MTGDSAVPEPSARPPVQTARVAGAVAEASAGLAHRGGHCLDCEIIETGRPGDVGGLNSGAFSTAAIGRTDSAEGE